MSENTLRRIGMFASVMSVLMYVSYIVQIWDNLHGNRGDWVQPMVACINCIVWSVYGIFSKPKQWPIIIANIPGIFLAGITVFTALVH